MTEKIAWLVATLLMGAVLAVSCAPAATPTSTPVPTSIPTPIPATAPTPAPTAGPEVPKYGGVFIAAMPRAHDNFDDAMISGSYVPCLHLTNEALSMGDWTKGPAGTNEFDFTPPIHLDEYTIGWLAGSWEVPDPNTIIFHNIRDDVHYALNPASEASRLVNGRTVTAADVAFCIERKCLPTGYFGNELPGWFKSATAIDKKTVVVKGDNQKQSTAIFLERLITLLNIYPPEVVGKYGNMLDWRNSVGTGPFILKDVVPDSSYTLVRNPNYWAKNPIGPGKGNQLPYLDGVVWLDIRDPSTRLAALRTARIDYVGTESESNLLREDVQGLLRTNPELKSYGYRPKTKGIFMRTDKPELPFDDIRVRRALYMALDFQGIVKDYYGGDAAILTCPVDPVFQAAYTPIEQLPESTRELFSFKPDKAKQLLAEAGYPKGFKTTILITPDEVDVLSIIKDSWSKIGVDLLLEVKESSVHRSIRLVRSHQEMITGDTKPASQARRTTEMPTGWTNASMVNDPWIVEQTARKFAFENMGNTALRNQLDKEYALYVLDKAYWIQLPAPNISNVWQPWVKNYRGENMIGLPKSWVWLYYTWLDQTLKNEMIGR